MAQRKATRQDEDWWEEPEAFLLRRGIVPVNGTYTQQQLTRELIRRGWRWRVDPGRVAATKAYPPAGTVAQTIVASDADQVAALTSVLVDAIRFDEQHGLGLARPMEADVVVRAPDQHVIAIVEAKAVRDLTDRVASDLRGNLITNSSGYALASFFLLVSPDSGYFWDQRSDVLPFSPATRTFSMAPVIARYLPWLEPGERPGENELAQAVAAWLDDLANPKLHRSVPADEAFAGTEFLDAIQGASILTNAAA